MQKLLNIVFVVLGALFGIFIVWISLNVLGISSIFFMTWYLIIIFYLFGAFLFAIILYSSSKAIIKFITSNIKWVENKIQEIPMMDIFYGSVGLIIALTVSYLISFPLNLIRIPWLSILLTVFIYCLLSYFGVTTSIKRKEEINSIIWLKKTNRLQGKVTYNQSRKKILDTSVIIDGRIFDLCRTGFIEGSLIIPIFVLNELRHIADSSDQLKRIRGRRGLDILNKIQNELEISVEVTDKDYDDINEVDVKLLRLGLELDAIIVTNDYNLNKVAEFQRVTVLNINELANAIKSVVMPGEEMIVQVVKDGKELGQGVAYLDDGTMIVVDGGKRHIGESIGVVVTSVFQTAAGRMIFAKYKTMDD